MIHTYVYVSLVRANQPNALIKFQRRIGMRSTVKGCDHAMSLHKY